MNLSGPGPRLRRHNRTKRGPAACEKARSPAYAGIEARVPAAIQEQLIEAVMAEVIAERPRRLRADAQRRRGLEADLAQVKRRAARPIDQVASGELYPSGADRGVWLAAPEVRSRL